MLLILVKFVTSKFLIILFLISTSDSHHFWSILLCSTLEVFPSLLFCKNFSKGPVTPNCVPTACSWRCKIHWIAGGSQGKFRKNVVLFENFTSGDVTASWRRPGRSYGAPTAFTCVSTEFYLAINRALAESPPSVLGVFTARPRCALRADCVQKTFFTTW